jgi:hypothetical protein
VGHGHPVVKAAVAAQMDKQSLHSQVRWDGGAVAWRGWGLRRRRSLPFHHHHSPAWRRS